MKKKSVTGRLLEIVAGSYFVGAEPLLLNLNLKIIAGNCYGLIGRNGCGKSTLLQLLARQLPLAEGELICRSNLASGFVSQQLGREAAVDQQSRETVEEYLLRDYYRLRAGLENIEQQLAQVSKPDRVESLLAEYQKEREIFDAAEGDRRPQTVEQLIENLGIAAPTTAVAALSGGENSLLALAAGLAGEPELLLLDEPDNHLDYPGLVWLCQFINNYAGAVVIVSHNRYLLDRLCTHIWQIEDRLLTEYSGNYSDYRIEKLQKGSADSALYNAQQQQLRRLEQMVKRFAEFADRYPDGAWGRRLRARRTQLKKRREQSIDKPRVDKRQAKISFAADVSQANIMLKVTNYSKSFDNREIFNSVNFTIHNGDKVALIGNNGSGKTTLLRDIITCCDDGSGRIRIGPSCRVGYVSQGQEIFNDNASVEQEFIRLGCHNRQEVFALLNRYLFAWRDLDKTVCSLSGGELNRLKLACTQLLKANFLILDEPTNHTDISTREAIEQALSQFNGAILLVSHDRYLLEKVCDRVIYIDNLQVKNFTGSANEYYFRFHQSLLTRSGGKLTDRKKERQSIAGDKNCDQNKSNNLTEARLERLEREKARLEKKAEQALGGGDHQLSKRLTDKLKKTSKEIDELYSRWFTEER